MPSCPPQSNPYRHTEALEGAVVPLWGGWHEGITRTSRGSCTFDRLEMVGAPISDVLKQYQMYDIQNQTMYHYIIIYTYTLSTIIYIGTWLNSVFMWSIPWTLTSRVKSGPIPGTVFSDPMWSYGSDRRAQWTGTRRGFWHRLAPCVHGWIPISWD